MRDPQRRWPAAALAGAIACGYVVGVLVLSADFSPLPPDTASHLGLARNLVEGNGFVVDYLYLHAGLADSVRHVAELHGLLQPLAFAGLFTFLPIEASVARIPGVLFLAATALLVWGFARRRFGAGPGWFAFALVLASPSLLLFAISGLEDVVFAFFTTLTLVALDRALERPTLGAFALAGTAAGLAVVAKPIGFVLPAAFAVMLVSLRRDGIGAVAGRAAAAALPFLSFGAVYPLRNVLAYGAPGFRYGAFEWIYKAGGFEAGLALYEGHPARDAVLAALGTGGVARLAWVEFRALADAMLRIGPVALSGDALVESVHGFLQPAPLVLVGLAAGVVMVRREPRLGAVIALASAAMVVLVCVPFHFEVRYFACAIPWIAILVAAALRDAGPVREWLPPTRRKAASRAVAAGAAIVLGLSIVETGQVLTVVASQPLETRPCSEALYWIERETEPDDRVLTFLPWHVNWFTRREAIMIPSGGESALATVARHYRARWLLVSADGRRPETSRLVGSLGRKPSGLRVEQVWSDGQCRVLRIDL